MKKNLFYSINMKFHLEINKNSKIRKFLVTQNYIQYKKHKKLKKTVQVQICILPVKIGLR